MGRMFLLVLLNSFFLIFSQEKKDMDKLQKEINVFVEGFTTDGQLISEIRKVAINTK